MAWCTIDPNYSDKWLSMNHDFSDWLERLSFTEACRSLTKYYSENCKHFTNFELVNDLCRRKESVIRSLALNELDSRDISDRSYRELSSDTDLLLTGDILNKYRALTNES